MGTKGQARPDHRSEALRQLPEEIARREAAGHPVVVAWPIATLGLMPEDKQRLYATLGVLVRFVPPIPPRTEE